MWWRFLVSGLALGALACGGAEDENEKREARPLSGVEEIAVGLDFTCARMTDGTARCWGRNFEGELGAGYRAGDESARPVPVRDQTGVIGIGAGFTTACAISGGGDVNCWGDVTASPRDIYFESPTPIIVFRVSAVSVGSDHSCALLDDATVACWGRRLMWVSEDPDPFHAELIEGIRGAVDVSGGDSHSCAVLSDGSVSCWGSLPERLSSPVAVPIEGVRDAVQISTSLFHSCAVFGDGKVRCWGMNTAGVLGDGTTTDSTTPVEVVGIDDAILVSTDDTYGCAVVRSGGVYCWGQNVTGRLGDGTLEDSLVPVRVKDIENAVSVSVGDFHACAVLSDATARCWGENVSGSLGDGTFEDSPAPVVVRADP